MSSGDLPVPRGPARATCSQRSRRSASRSLLNYASNQTSARYRAALSSEIENLHPAVVGDEDVLWLDVSMNDPAFVRSSETIGDRDRVAAAWRVTSAPWSSAARSVRPCSSSLTMYGAPS